MLKPLLLLVATVSLSGCCRVLGICTSASIHTSIASPQQFAEQRSLHDVLTASEAPVLAGLNRRQADGRTE
jgi:hypothetical protein